MTFLASLRTACEQSTYKKFDTATGPCGGGLVSISAADLMRLADSFDEMRCALGLILNAKNQGATLVPDLLTTLDQAHGRAVELLSK